MKAKFLIFYLFYVGTLLLNGCSSEFTETSNANAVNFNAPTNAGSENVLTNIETQKSENNAMVYTPINRNTLSAALKNRLKQDKSNVLTDKDWEGDVWLEQHLGLFYKNDDEFIRDVVCKVTLDLLKPNNERLTEVSQKRLRQKIKHDTKCKAAVGEMLSAAIDTEPINPIP